MSDKDPMTVREVFVILAIVLAVLVGIGVARGGDSVWKIIPPDTGVAFTDEIKQLVINGQVVAEFCNHKCRTGWAYAMVCELPDCPESNPPTMSLRLEWCERCGILRMPENRRKMGREVRE